jgi:predicted nucleic acid-binding Zn ribbon protein
MSYPRWRSPVPVAEAVSSALKLLGVEGRVRQGELWQVWPAVVGPQIARHAQPQTVQQGRLIVHVTDPVWLHQLSMMRHNLLAALNERLGPPAFREIVLRIGPVQALPTGPDPGPLMPEPERPLDPETSGRIEELLSPVQDAPFAEALRRLLRRSAGSRETGPSSR